MAIDKELLLSIARDEEKSDRLAFVSKGITPDDVKDLMGALRTNTMITTLNLYSNDLGDEGIKHIAENLNATPIVHLDVGSNRITNDGAKLLAETIKINVTLQSLGLYLNNIDDTGAQLLVDAMQKNLFIVSMDLLWNKADVRGAVLGKLNELCDRNKKIAQCYKKGLPAYQKALIHVQKNAKAEDIIKAFEQAQTEAQKEASSLAPSLPLLALIEEQLKIYRDQMNASAEGEKSSKIFSSKHARGKSSPSASRRFLIWATGKNASPPKEKEARTPGALPARVTEEVVATVSTGAIL